MESKLSKVLEILKEQWEDNQVKLAIGGVIAYTIIAIIYLKNLRAFNQSVVGQKYVNILLQGDWTQYFIWFVILTIACAGILYGIFRLIWGTYEVERWHRLLVFILPIVLVFFLFGCIWIEIQVPILRIVGIVAVGGALIFSNTSGN
jgi:hypothetical protein